eukprot:1179719-Rhodomonas_salina.1
MYPGTMERQQLSQAPFLTFVLDLHSGCFARHVIKNCFKETIAIENDPDVFSFSLLGRLSPKCGPVAEMWT